MRAAKAHPHIFTYVHLHTHTRAHKHTQARTDSAIHLYRRTETRTNLLIDERVQRRDEGREGDAVRLRAFVLVANRLQAEVERGAVHLYNVNQA